MSALPLELIKGYKSIKVQTLDFDDVIVEGRLSCV